MKHVCICLIIGSLLFTAVQEFPTAAFHVDDTTWYQGAGEDRITSG